MKFEKRVTAQSGIPTASIPDIVFMLLLFFMVSTVFKQASGLKVVLPQAKKIEKLPGKRDVAYIYIDRSERISIDDRLVRVEDIGTVMYAKRADKLHPLKVTSLRIDQDVKMGLVTDVQEELRKADALNVNYSAKPGT